MALSTPTKAKKYEHFARKALAVLFLFFSCGCIFCSSQAALMSVTQERINASMVSHDTADYYNDDEVAFAPLNKTIVQEVLQDEVRAVKKASTPLPVGIVAMPTSFFSPTPMPSAPTLTAVPVSASSTSFAKKSPPPAAPPTTGSKATTSAPVKNPVATAPPAMPTPPMVLPTLAMPLPTLPVAITPPLPPTPPPANTPAPAPKPTSKPTSTHQPPTFTPIPTFTPTPTSTPSPTFTATPSPTNFILAFSQATFSVNENAADALITVTLNSASPITVTVDYATHDGTASNHDYLATNGTLIFSPNQTESSFTVSIIDDSLKESTETLSLTLTQPVMATLGTPQQATLFIIDNDSPPTIQFSSNNYLATEIDKMVTLTATLSAVSGVTITAHYVTADGTALAGLDYLATHGNLIFLPGQTEQPFTITIINDQLVENDETFSVIFDEFGELSKSALVADLQSATDILPNQIYFALVADLQSATDILPNKTYLPLIIGGQESKEISASRYRSSIAPITATVTIISDDKPTIQFSQADYWANEGDQATTITVTMDVPLTWAVAVSYTTGDGSATSNQDYTPVSGTLIFNPAQTLQTFTVPIFDDNFSETNETVALMLAPAELSPSYHLIPTATLTIVDNDGLPEAQFSQPTTMVNESDTSAVITVTLSQPSALTVTVDYDIFDSTPISGRLIFPPFLTTTNIFLSIIDDSLNTPTKTITLSLTNSVNALIGQLLSTTLTIAEDDPPPAVQFSQPQYFVNESEPWATLAVTLSAPSGFTTSVHYISFGGTAMPDNDYLPVSGTLVFPPSLLTQTFRLLITDDLLYEDNETLFLQLDSPVNLILGNPVTATLTIVDNDSLPIIQLNSNHYQANENQGLLTLTVILNQPAALTVTVDYLVTDNDGFPVISGTLVFPPLLLTPQTLLLPIPDDQIVSGDKIFNMTLSNPVQAILGEPHAATVTIMEDDTFPTVQFSSSAYSIPESGGAVMVDVTLSKAPIVTATVAYQTSDGTALANSDYTPMSGTLIFPPSLLTPQTLLLPILDDAIFEPTESFNLNLLTATDAIIASPDVAAITIIDEDDLWVQFNNSTYTVTENAGSLTIVALLNKPSTHAVTVQSNILLPYATMPITSTLTFLAGQTAFTMTIPITDNLIPEPNKTFLVTLSNPLSATLGLTHSTSVTILDDDMPTVQFANSNYTIYENTGTVTLTVILSKAVNANVTVSYNKINDTANGSDYDTASGLLTFAPFQISQTLTVAIINDALIEPDETFLVALHSPINAMLGATNPTTVTIQNDDLPMVQFATSGYSVNENGGTLPLNVTLNSSSFSTITVNYATSNLTAIAGNDYSPLNGTLTFNPGQTTLPLTTTILDDSLDELNETFVVTLSSPINAVLGATNPTTVTIIDDDVPATNFSTPAYTVNEGSGSAMFTVTLTIVPIAPVTVNYASGNGTAISGSDYGTTSGSLTFPIGSTMMTFTVPISDDNLAELNETFIVTLSNPSSAVLGTTTTATMTIVDNEKPLVQFSSGNFTATEGISATAWLTVTLNMQATYPITVSYATADGTAFAPADYLTTNGTLAFAPFSTSKNFTISLTNDFINEVNKTFTTSPISATLGVISKTVVTIIDDDIPKITFISTTQIVTEGVGTVLITVTMDLTAASSVTVNYNTNGVSAFGGSDYTPLSSNLTFSPNQTVTTFTVSIIDDLAPELIESFTINLSNPSSNAMLGITPSTTIAIIDDEPPTLYFATNVFFVTEGITMAAFSVRLAPTTTYTVTVNYETINDTALDSEDYITSSGIITFTPGNTNQTFSVPITDDALIEWSETFTILLSSPSPPVPTTTLGTPYSATVTILDNDMSVINFAAGVFTTTENVGSLPITVTLNPTSTDTITVTYTTANGTALSSQDYVAASGIITFNPGNTSQTFLLTITDDNIFEPTESFALTLSAPSPVPTATIGTASTVITIIDDDPNPLLQFITNTFMVTEGLASIPITVTLNPASSDTITVTYITNDGTALVGFDYTTTPGTLTFAPGIVTQSFSVPITDDAITEGTETFTITLTSASVTATLSITPATVTIIDNDP